MIGGIRIQADENKEPANLWKEALSESHGKPRLFANEVKTNVDTFWQLNMKLTLLMPLICLSRYTKIIQIQGIRIQVDENKESDDERFTKENYSKFNFPAQNSQGLTSDYSKGTY